MRSYCQTGCSVELRTVFYSSQSNHLLMDREDLPEDVKQLIQEEVEKRVEERVQERLKEAEGRKEEGSSENDNESEDSGISRRGFLKSLGAGAAGLGFMAMVPGASALNIRDDDLSFYGGKDQSSVDFNVDTNGNITNVGRIENVTDIQFTGSSTPSIETAGGGSDTFNIYDAANSQTLMTWNEGGPVEVKNTDLYVDGYIDLGRDATDANIEFHDSSGTKRNTLQWFDGGGVFRLYDDDNNQNLMLWHNGGPVEVRNANLDVGSNSVTTNNFEITENSSTNSLDFNYTG